MFKKKTNKIGRPFGDTVLDVITSVLLFSIIIIVGYPVIYVVSCSFSGAVALQSGQVVLWPVDFSLAGYNFVFQYQRIWIGYRNTIFYTIAGTMITLFAKTMVAYPISRPRFHARGVYTKLLIVTMLVNAGLIPTFLIKSKLGMYDTVWAVLLAGILGASDIFILRTAFKSSIPGELYDAAYIDGANEFQVLWKIAIPLAKATISVLTLYAIVGCWNDYFNAMIYLRNENLFPLSLFLRTLLTTAQGIESSGMDTSMQEQAQNGTEQIRYALIVISTLPVLLAYAVVQKYFKGGVMVGSVKG